MTLKFFGKGEGGLLKADNILEFSKFVFRHATLEERIEFLTAILVSQSVDCHFLDQVFLPLLAQRSGLEVLYVQLLEGERTRKVFVVKDMKVTVRVDDEVLGEIECLSSE